MKNRSLLYSVLLAAFFIASSSANDLPKEDSVVQWELNRQHYDLLDEEKRLLKEGDELSYVEMDLKRKILEWQKQLSATEAKLDAVRHRLVTVRMKLLP